MHTDISMEITRFSFVKENVNNISYLMETSFSKDCIYKSTYDQNTLLMDFLIEGDSPVVNLRR